MAAVTVSSLDLKVIHRPGEETEDCIVHERYTYDFVIDNNSLAALLKVRECDFVGLLQRDPEYLDWNRRSIDRLLLLSPAPIEPNRFMLFVCPECADLGCGAFTAEISRSGKAYTWSGFQFENNYDSSNTIRFEDVGPFTFDEVDYESVLRGILN